MTNLTVTLTKKVLFFRYDGDPVDFDISNSNLRLFLKTIWIDELTNEIYQSEINYTPIVVSISDLNLTSEFQSIQSKLASQLPPLEEPANPIPEGLTNQVRIWRYQGEIFNGELLQTSLEFWLHSVLVDSNNVFYYLANLPTFKGNIVDLGILEEFQAIQSKLNILLNEAPETKTIELEAFTKVWVYQGLQYSLEQNNISTAIAEFYVKKGLRDIATGELYKVEQLPILRGTPEDLGLLPEYQALQGKLDVILEGL